MGVSGSSALLHCFILLRGTRKTGRERAMESLPSACNQSVCILLQILDEVKPVGHLLCLRQGLGNGHRECVGPVASNDLDGGVLLQLGDGGWHRAIRKEGNHG
jgi:hypothetical protein